MQIGISEHRTHDYVRHGTTTLFVAPGHRDPARSPGYASYVIVTTNSLPCSSGRDGSDR
jgi:hypothetical protein